MNPAVNLASNSFSGSSLHELGDWWLLLTLAVPALAALGLLATPARWWVGQRGPGVAAAVGLVTVPLSALAAASGQSFSWEWVPALGVRFGLRADGLSGPLVVLTSLVVALCLMYLLRIVPPAGKARALAGLILLVETGLLGTFLATDMLQFFVFFEVALVPLWSIVSVWGTQVEEGLADGRRLVTTANQAATQFVCYTVVGSTLMLVGLLLIGLRAGTFDLATLAAGPHLSSGTQLAALLLVGAGLAVKVPLWPVHAWLPAAHTAAPTVGSVLLAAVMLKTGTYGWLRIIVPILPQAMRQAAPYLATLAVIGIVVSALACLRQTDLKRLIAYGSVGHMGFVMLGISTLTPVGLTGAMLGNLAHGLITGLLFFLVGALKDRYHTSALDELPRAVYARLPRLGVLFGFAAVASLGLPGLVGFWGELLTLMGAYHPGAGLSSAWWRACLVAALVGLVLTAAYLLRVIRQVLQGPIDKQTRFDRPEAAAWVGDLSRHELWVFAPLAVAVVGLGVMPQLLTWMLSPMAAQLLGGGQ